MTVQLGPTGALIAIQANSANFDTSQNELRISITKRWATPLANGVALTAEVTLTDGSTETYSGTLKQYTWSANTPNAQQYVNGAQAVVTDSVSGQIVLTVLTLPTA